MFPSNVPLNTLPEAEADSTTTAPHPSRCRPPSYMNTEAFESVKSIPLEDSDVIMCSYPKCGTSQMNSILIALLKMDQEGQLTVPETSIGVKMQVYPDAVSMKRPEGVAPRGDHFMKAWCMEDLLDQSAPRLLTAHMRADTLPEALMQKGRFVLMARNPKDACVSMWSFLQKHLEPPLSDMLSEEKLVMSSLPDSIRIGVRHSVVLAGGVSAESG